MLGQIFGTIGGLIGKEFFGGGILSSISRFAGRTFGNYLESKNSDPDEIYNFKNVRDGFTLTAVSYGAPIPLVFGNFKLDGKIIWASKINKMELQNTEKSYFATGQTKNIYYTTSFEYYLSFAMSICEGEIAEIARVWVNNELTDLANYKFRLYKGSKDQPVDPLIAALEGQAPAFRDLAYIIFEDINLGEYGNRIPVFSFEVTRKCNLRTQIQNSCVEDIVKSMVMIPGSGEYVYDTIVQYKIIKSFNNTPISRQKINSHNYQNIANSLHSLNQLQTICSNIEWIAPVVCWFGDNLDAGKCNIMPAVEFNDPNLDYSENWQVANYSRNNARLISRDHEGNPKYGGSINDASVVRYLKELKNRGLKIMFYPMFFLDVEQKPWRGRLTGSPQDIRNFFNKPKGYNEFILHYARLVKDHVDAFVIGSELIGLTKVVESAGIFPAVDEFVKLAAMVKQIVGINVLVTYAADWSEYHHTDGGWYNLDPLWASPNIDFVGIDAYFPVTGSTSSNISAEDIINGWQKGQGYDYYFDSENKPQLLSAPYAWKNIKYWWENIHYNPDGRATGWVPKSKKIWFTEFGFPSIDKATNQPNVFFDPLCADGGVPIHSSGEIDFSIQRRSIKAFIEYWDSQEYMEQVFLWTWDARPYPAWPHMNFWRDGYLWEKGHWVNNKFGAASVAAIILELSQKCGMNIEKIDVSSLDESVEGFIIDRDVTASDVINLLRIGYFFDIKTCQQDKIIFVRRGQNMPVALTSSRLIKIVNNSYLQEIAISPKDIINKIELNFFNHINEYNSCYVQLDNEYFGNKVTAKVQLPIVFSAPEAERLAKLILNNATIENRIVKFIIPVTSLEYEPTDVIIFNYLHHNYQLRIISIVLKGLKIEITSIIDEFESYYLPQAKNNLAIKKQVNQADFCVIDLPINFISDKSHLLAYLSSSTSQNLYVAIGSIDASYNKIKNLQDGAIIGILLSYTQKNKSNVFLIDRMTKFTMFYPNFPVTVMDKWNLCMIGNELIRFKNWQKIGDDIYEISHLIRGIFATEEFISKHQTSEKVIFPDIAPNIIEVSDKLEGKLLFFKLPNHDVIHELQFQNKSQKLFMPYIKKCEINKDLLLINLQPRHNFDDWKAHNRNKKYKFTVTINNSHNFTTNDTNIIINLLATSLSGVHDIIIIMQDEMYNASLPLKLHKLLANDDYEKLLSS